MVVVSNADKPTMVTSGWSSMALMKVEMGTSTPRSITSTPALSIIMPTRFLPMSWKSPATVPRIILPTLPPPSPFR